METIFFATFTTQLPNGSITKSFRMEYFKTKKTLRELFDWAIAYQKDLESSTGGGTNITDLKRIKQ